MSVAANTRSSSEAPRRALRSLWRGFRGRCPACGEGAMFPAYLKVADRCPACGEILHHQRADDAPPYVTMFVTCHVTVAFLLAEQGIWPDAPFLAQAAACSALLVVLSLLLLPRVKGALVGLQWGLQMHGFGDEQSDPSQVTLEAPTPSMRS